MLEGKIARPNVIIEAKIIRADGTEEELGIICDSRNETKESIINNVVKFISGGKQ